MVIVVIIVILIIKTMKLYDASSTGLIHSKYLVSVPFSLLQFFMLPLFYGRPPGHSCSETNYPDH